MTKQPNNKEREARRHRREAIGASAILFVLVVIGFSILLYYLTPSEIVEQIGIHNGYLIVLIGGFLGGISLFFPFPNYIIVFTLGAGHLNPWLLGIAAGVGVIAGETTSYLVGHKSRPLLSSRVQLLLDRFNQWSLKKHSWTLPIALFFLGSISPFPNDFVLVPLGLARHPFWRTIIPLGLGNIAFNIMVAYAGLYGLLSF